MKAYELFIWKEFWFCGKICDYWSLTYKNYVYDVVHIIIICTLYLYDAFD